MGQQIDISRPILRAAWVRVTGRELPEEAEAFLLAALAVGHQEAQAERFVARMMTMEHRPAFDAAVSGDFGAFLHKLGLSDVGRDQCIKLARQYGAEV